MLYNLLTPLTEDFQVLNLFRYLTFRTGGAMMTALFFSLIIGQPFINWLKTIQVGASNVRAYTPENHLAKAGTPSMGGALIIMSICITTILWADITNTYVWIILLITIGYGAIGFVDDWLKISKKNSAGLPGKLKLFFQIIIALAGILIFQDTAGEGLETTLALPFAKNLLIDMGIFFIPFAILVIIGSSNAVNITDGLDGLAIVPVLIAAVCFGLISYIVGNAVYSNYLGVTYVTGTGELAVVAGAIVGSAMGFLWFNAPPAMVFMGDTGSLSLGGALGTFAVITKHEIVLSIIGGLFVLETVSVIVQVISFKLTGKRLFAMAPLHHHYEKKGLAESTIVIRFWIVAVVLAIIGLSTLKLR